MKEGQGESIIGGEESVFPGGTWHVGGHEAE